MPTETYFDDIVRLADQLREFPLELDPPSPSTVGVYMIEVHIKSADLRAISSVNNALQLAFDAAGMALFESTDEVGLDLTWGGAGSWREVFIVSPRTALGRERLNYLVGTALAALPLIEGLNPALGWSLYSIFAGSMLVASSRPDAQRAPIPLETVDASALSGVVVDAQLYPPGKIWRAPAGPASEGRLAKLSEYVCNHEDAVFFTVMRQSGDRYDVALVVESEILEIGRARALAEWHAEENQLPHR